jgi:DNA-binding GntR family transcriptional regulator
MVKNGQSSEEKDGMSATRGQVDDLVAQIRSAIVNGDFYPNEHLIEGQLAAQFWASRSAVRAALIELASEGLVEREANRGARVRAVQWNEALEISEVRRLLEALCAAKAAERITPEESEDLLQLIAQMEETVENDDRLGFSQLNWVLHDRIREISGHQTASEIVHRLRNQAVRYHFQAFLAPGRQADSLEEHRAVVEAIVARDPQRAESAARAHFDSSIKTLLSARTDRPSPLRSAREPGRQLPADRGRQRAETI